MSRRTTARILKIFSFTAAVAVLLLGLLSGTLSPSVFRILLVSAGCFLLILVFCADRFYRSLVSDFSNDICETVDALMEDREPDNFQPYEDSAVSKAQGKLLQYYDKMRDEHRQSALERQTLQELVSDISHQVKTPVANIQMFTGILREHELDPEKRNEFLSLMSAQISKLDFLMQSLIKMSRLETGTFTIHMEESRLSDTIARAVSAVWAKAEQKDLQIDVDCGSDVLVRHDAKWTAEALGNILDNAVKYTPAGGAILIQVRPWQFYTRIDIADTGIGIAEEHYNDVFRRFYRAEEVASEEGVGLGLYLARGIITRQHGYISVKSKQGEGSTFSVYLLT